MSVSTHFDEELETLGCALRQLAGHAARHQLGAHLKPRIQADDVAATARLPSSCEPPFRVEWVKT